IAFRSFEPYSLAWFDFPGVGDSTIWTVASDGSQLRQITTPNNPAGQHVTPSWSPDGKRVAFAALGAKIPLWTVDISSGELKSLLPENSGPFAGPAFAPNGDDLFFVGGSKGGNFAIYHARSGAKPELLYSTRNDVPMGLNVSPDGKRLMY